MLSRTDHKFGCEDCEFKKMSCLYVEPDSFEEFRQQSIKLSFSKGETIFKQGGKSGGLLFLHEGIVKFCYQYDSGSNYIMTIVRGPKLLGGANLFFKSVNIFSITAMEDSRVCMLDSAAFMKLAIGNPAYFLALVENTMDMFQDAIFNFISLAHNHVNGRIATILLYLHKNVYNGQGYSFTVSRKEIAEFAACSHENVINTLSRFRKEGIIEFHGKEIEIINIDLLEEISRKG